MSPFLSLSWSRFLCIGQPDDKFFALETQEKFTNLHVILTMHLLYLAALFVAMAAATPTVAPTKKCPEWDLGGIWGKVSGKKNANNVTCNVTFCLFACS